VNWSLAVRPWSLACPSCSLGNGIDLEPQRLMTDDCLMTIRRMKAYTGGQGYVYQYYFVGKRPAPAASGNIPSTEYIFDVTSDRKTTFSVSIFLADQAVRDWAGAHGRALTDAEQYGAVKMRLFQGFDEIEDMMTHGRRLEVTAEDLQRVLATLGVT
jgi:hypothetical protein